MIMKKLIVTFMMIISTIFYAQKPLEVFNIDRIYSSKYDVTEEVSGDKLILYDDPEINAIYFKWTINYIERKDKYVVFDYEKEKNMFHFKVKSDIDGTEMIISIEKIFNNRFKIYMIKSEDNFLILFAQREKNVSE